MPAPIVDLAFSHVWEAQILPARPLILPQRHFVYPREAEEVERGALEVLVRPDAGRPARESHPKVPLDAQSFLATCALGFRDQSVPTGIWSCPKPEEICAVAGGYAYVIDTTAPQRFTMLPSRPVLEVRSLPAQGLLLFVGHRSILAWGAQGHAWESDKLSDEGVTIASIEGGILRGLGWQIASDQETPFALDLKNGERLV
jgi:hypothetical protein